MLRLLHQKAGYLGSFARTRDTLALRDSLCFRYVPPSKRNKVWILWFFVFVFVFVFVCYDGFFFLFFDFFLIFSLANRNNKFNLGD